MAQRDEALADKRRFDWLELHSHLPSRVVNEFQHCTLRQAIDAAMKGQG